MGFSILVLITVQRKFSICVVPWFCFKREVIVLLNLSYNETCIKWIALENVLVST